jgi:hypothetical protein
MAWPHRIAHSRRACKSSANDPKPAGARPRLARCLKLAAARCGAGFRYSASGRGRWRHLQRREAGAVVVIHDRHTQNRTRRSAYLRRLKKKRVITDSLFSPKTGVPTGIRTPVTAVKGRCPRPLDDGDLGGAKRDRTADLLHAMQALSQLSYSPERDAYCKERFGGCKAFFSDHAYFMLTAPVNLA